MNTEHPSADENECHARFFFLSRLQVGRLIHYCFMGQLLAIATVLLTMPSKYWMRYICSSKPGGGLGGDNILQTV